MTKRRIDVTYTILTLAVIASLFFLVMMFRENERLKQSMGKASARINRIEGSLSGPPGIQKGDLVPSFETEDRAGRKYAVQYDGSTRYLFFVFSQHCGSCDSQYPKWKSFEAEVARPGLRTVSMYMNEDPNPVFERKYALDKEAGTMIKMPNMAVQRAYRVAVLPQYVLVSARGEVEWASLGSLEPQSAADLKRAIAGK